MCSFYTLLCMKDVMKLILRRVSRTDSCQFSLTCFKAAQVVYDNFYKFRLNLTPERAHLYLAARAEKRFALLRLSTEHLRVTLDTTAIQHWNTINACVRCIQSIEVKYEVLELIDATQCTEPLPGMEATEIHALSRYINVLPFFFDLSRTKRLSVRFHSVQLGLLLEIVSLSLSKYASEFDSLTLINYTTVHPLLLDSYKKIVLQSSAGSLSATSIARIANHTATLVLQSAPLGAECFKNLAVSFEVITVKRLACDFYVELSVVCPLRSKDSWNVTVIHKALSVLRKHFRKVRLIHTGLISKSVAHSMINYLKPERVVISTIESI